MDESKMEDLIIAYIEGTLAEDLKEEVGRAIGQGGEWKEEYERLSGILQMMDKSVELQPEPWLREEFDKMLEREIQADDTRVVKLRNTSSRWVWRGVAAVVLGIAAGLLITRNIQSQRQLEALQKEMELTKQLVMTSLQDESSAISRLRGVNTSMELQVADDEITETLIQTMNSDENTNVRLAAVAALARFSDESSVREALIRALETQEDPVVMIHLINLMVQLKESGAVEPLRNLLDKDEIHEAVRDEVHMGILELT